MLNGIRGDSRAGKTETAPEGGGDIAKLEQQKQQYQNELEQVQSKQKYSAVEQKATEKEVKRLKSKIAEIEKRIQQLSQRSNPGKANTFNGRLGSGAIKSSKEFMNAQIGKAEKELGGIDQVSDPLYTAERSENSLGGTVDIYI